MGRGFLISILYTCAFRYVNEKFCVNCKMLKLSERIDKILNKKKNAEPVGKLHISLSLSPSLCFSNKNTQQRTSMLHWLSEHLLVNSGWGYLNEQEHIQPEPERCTSVSLAVESALSSFLKPGLSGKWHTPLSCLKAELCKYSGQDSPSPLSFLFCRVGKLKTYCWGPFWRPWRR